MNHEMKLNPAPYAAIKTGKKNRESSICPFCGGNVRMTVAEENHTVFACDCCDMSIDLENN